jgi:hypothetical protein
VPVLAFSLDARMNLTGKPVRATLDGRVSRVALAGRERRELWRVAGAKFRAEAAGVPERPAMTIDLVWYIERDEDGAPAALYFPAETPVEQRRVLEYLSGALVRPPTGPVESHPRVRRERDAMGWFDVRYRRVGPAVERVKLAYDRSSSGLDWKIERSHWSLRGDGTGELAALSGSERLSGAADPLRVELETALQANAISSGELAVAPLPAGSLRYVFGTAGEPTRIERDRIVVQGADLDTVLTSLTGAAMNKLPWEALYRGAALLRLDPSRLSQVAAYSKAHPAFYEAAVQLVAETDSAPAQAMLVDWIAAHDGAEPYRMALRAIVHRIHHPAPALVDYLLARVARADEHADDHVIESFGALAALTGQAAAQDDARAAGWLRALLELCDRNPGKRLRPGCVAQLGVVQRPEALATVLRSSEDSDVDVRKASIDGLGRQQDPKATTRLLAALAHDPRPEIRGRAAGALSVDGLVRGRQALTAALDNDDSEVVRVEVVRALGRLVRSDATVSKALERALRREPSAWVRREINRMLGNTNDGEHRRETR